MNVVKVLTGFVPMVAFSVLSTRIGAGWAAVAALVLAVVVIAATARNGVKELPLAQAGIVAAMAVLAFTGGPTTDGALVKYGPAAQGLLLGLLMLATASTAPFTATYARETAPREVWHTRRFLEVNQHISAAWGVAVLVLGLANLAAAEIPVTGGHLALRLAVSWVVPLAVVWRVVAYTKHTAAAAQREAQERHAEAQGAHGAHEAGEVRA